MKNLKTKIKPYDVIINTNFYGEKIPKEDSHYVCLSVILIYFVFRTGKIYYTPSCAFRKM